jgi:2-aminoadipate transaminase
MGSFSKILSPGLRVGYVIADPEIIKKLVIAKQSADVCASVLSQRIAHEYIVRGHIDPQVARIRQLYGRKLDLMLRGLEEFMPEGVTWVKPDGGMFLWATLPKGLNSPDLLESALKKRVAFVSGRAFFPDPKDGAPYMRLNFTHPADDLITEGLKRLGAVVNQEIVSKWDRSADSSDRKIQDAVRGDLVGKS